MIVEWVDVVISVREVGRYERSICRGGTISLQSVLALFFFFQAEDGIRDVAVTGVQTCALPIFGGFYAAQQNGAFKTHGLDVEIVAGGVGTPTVQMVGAGSVEFGVISADELIVDRKSVGEGKRVDLGGRRIIKKKKKRKIGERIP